MGKHPHIEKVALDELASTVHEQAHLIALALMGLQQAEGGGHAALEAVTHYAIAHMKTAQLLEQEHKRCRSHT